jgi:hypothetical protein
MIEHFFNEFFIFGHAHIFSPLYIYLRGYTINDFLHLIMQNKMIEKINGPKK